MQLQSTYKVIYFGYGAIVKGYVPGPDLFDLMEMISKRHGYTYEDVKIAQAYRATLCLTTKENAKKWRQDIVRRQDGSYVRSDNSKRIEAYRNSKLRETSTI